MLFRNPNIRDSPEVVSATTASIQFWAEERVKIGKGADLLTKGVRKEKSVSWTLRFSLLAGLITTAGFLIRNAVNAREEYNQEASLILMLQQENQQNQTLLLNQYINTTFVHGISCNAPNGFSITATTAYYLNQTNNGLDYHTATYRELTLDPYKCGVRIAEANNQSISLNLLCNTTVWQFSIPDHNPQKLNAHFRQRCCPSLYGICKDILSFPTLPTYSEGKSIGSGIGAALSLITLVIELINTYLTEVRKTLSRPRCLFFPLQLKFCLLSKTDQEEITTIANEHNITIVADNLEATRANFQDALNKRIMPPNPDEIPLAPRDTLRI